jgi:hypothetical protein
MFPNKRSTGPLSFGFTSLENAVLTPGNSKFFSNPVADLASSINTTPSSLSQPNALQSEMDMHSELEMSGDVSGFEQNGTMDQSKNCSFILFFLVTFPYEISFCIKEMFGHRHPRRRILTCSRNSTKPFLVLITRAKV